jgi:hypothetical protein
MSLDVKTLRETNGETHNTDKSPYLPANDVFLYMNPGFHSNFASRHYFDINMLAYRYNSFHGAYNNALQNNPNNIANIISV